jgi:hypothetical protein
MERKGPNLQNIPIRTHDGSVRRVSDAFRVRHGSAFESMARALGWNTPPKMPPSPIMVAALRGLDLVVPDRVRGLRHSPEPTYNEIERRTMAQQGIDIHAEMAKLIFDGPPANAAEAKARRNAASTVGFAALYGGNKDDFFKNLRSQAKT